MAKHVGVVRDKDGIEPERRTRAYETYKDAYEVAERLRKRTLGKRGLIEMEITGMNRGLKYGYPTEAITVRIPRDVLAMIPEPKRKMIAELVIKQWGKKRKM